MEKYIELGKIIGPQGPAGVDGQDGMTASIASTKRTATSISTSELAKPQAAQSCFSTFRMNW